VRAPQSEVCRELKTAGFLAIGPVGLMAGGPEDHFTDSRELYVLVEGDEWAPRANTRSCLRLRQVSLRSGPVKRLTITRSGIRDWIDGSRTLTDSP
jgi:hypothetical protein